MKLLKIMALLLLAGAPASLAQQKTTSMEKKPMPHDEIRALDEAALPFKAGRTLYENALAQSEDVAGFRLEGEASVGFPNARLRLENTRAPSEDARDQQAANIVYWCPRDFPSDVEISWDFWPVREPGLAILFFSARGRGGEDIFDPKLKPRSGPYGQYHSGDIDALHVSYFRRRYPSEQALHVANLRKSHGFHLVAQGADPLPPVDKARGPYRIRLTKFGGDIRFFINDLPIFHWMDDGKSYGPMLGGGKIGFRQMAPLSAEYANLRVRELVAAPPKTGAQLNLKPLRSEGAG